MLDTEINFYNANRHKLRTQYSGKFIVIVKKQVIGAYNTHAEALAETRKSREVGTFIICNTSLGQRI